MSLDVSALARAEIEAFTDLYRAAPPELAKTAGLSVSPTRAGLVLAAAAIDVLVLNRALGLGLTGPVSSAAIDQLFDTLTTSGSHRFFLPVAPAGAHQALALALAERGLTHYNNWVRLTRSAADLPHLAASDIRVREIGREAAEAFGRIVSTAFGYPPTGASLAGQVVGRPGWRHYLAFDGETPIATAAMHLAGDTAWFGFAVAYVRPNHLWKRSTIPRAS